MRIKEKMLSWVLPKGPSLGKVGKPMGPWVGLGRTLLGFVVHHVMLVYDPLHHLFRDYDVARHVVKKYFVHLLHWLFRRYRPRQIGHVIRSPIEFYVLSFQTVFSSIDRLINARFTQIKSPYAHVIRRELLKSRHGISLKSWVARGRTCFDRRYCRVWSSPQSIFSFNFKSAIELGFALAIRSSCAIHRSIKGSRALSHTTHL